jgi:hypothetical protein
MHTSLRVLLPVGCLTILSACSDGGTDPIVEPHIAAEVSTTPEFATVSVGGTVALNAAARDDAGALIPSPSVIWNTLPATFASASGTGTIGTVGGVAPGVTRVSATVNSASDTTWVATLGPNSLLATAFIGARPSATVTRGQIVTVPITLDMSRVGANGDLGSARIDLLYNASILVYQSAVAGVAGLTTFTSPSPGVFRFALDAATPQGTPNLTLATVTFRVADTAALDAYTVLVLNHTAAPKRTNTTAYEAPVSVWGRVRVTQ